MVGQGVALASMVWGSALNAVLEALEAGGDQVVPRVRGHASGAWLLQETSFVCGPGSDEPDCHTENVHILLLVALLCLGICSVLGTYCMIREDKEEQLTPLCPQLIVKDAQLKFKLPLDDERSLFEILDSSDELVCKAVVDWPDHLKPGFSGVAATVRLQNSADMTLATVVAREVAVAGQGLALCRAGCEIFGFVEFDPVDPNLYTVRHRSGVELLKLHGEFDAQTMSVSMVNPGGLEVCSIRRVGDFCYGTVLQYVDAGLILSALFAAHVNRKLGQVASVVDCVSSPLRSPDCSNPVTPMVTPRQRLHQQPSQTSVSQVSGTWPPPSAVRDTSEDSREGSEVDAQPSALTAYPSAILPRETRPSVVPPLRRVGFEADDVDLEAAAAEPEPSGSDRPGRSIFPSPQRAVAPTRGPAGATGGALAAASAAAAAREPEEEPEEVSGTHAATDAAPDVEAPLAVDEAAKVEASPDAAEAEPDLKAHGTAAGEAARVEASPDAAEASPDTADAEPKLEQAHGAAVEEAATAEASADAAEAEPELEAHVTRGDEAATVGASPDAAEAAGVTQVDEAATVEESPDAAEAAGEAAKEPDPPPAEHPATPPQGPATAHPP